MVLRKGKGVDRQRSENVWPAGVGCRNENVYGDRGTDWGRMLVCLIGRTQRISGMN